MLGLTDHLAVLDQSSLMRCRISAAVSIAGEIDERCRQVARDRSGGNDDRRALRTHS